MASNIEEIKRLLNLDKQDKTAETLSKLESLLGDNSFLRALKFEDPQEYRKLLYNGQFEYYSPKQLLQVIGVYVKSFFVVLDGFVDVFIKLKRDDDSLFGARQLKKGDYFNDLALLTEQKSPVQYQANDLDGVCVLVVKQKEFGSLGTILNVWLDMNIQYLKNLPFLWNQNDKQIQLFHLLIIKEKVDEKQPVFLEGDKSNLVYLVLQGEFAVYKYFQDLQFRKLKEVSGNNFSVEDNVIAKAFHLQDFDPNKNIKARMLRVNEMFGEEDILSKRNRSFSIVCESQDAQLLVITKSVFKYILMKPESVRNYILGKLKVKDLELAKILNKQAGQVSSARIHILEKDQVMVKETQDFVKTRSFLNKQKGQYGKLAQSNIGSINASGVNNFDEESITRSANYKNSILKQTQNNFDNTETNFDRIGSLPLIDKKQANLPPLNSGINDYESGNTHHFSTKRFKQLQPNQPSQLRQSFQTSISQSQVGVKNLFFDQPASIKRSTSNYHTQNINYEDLRLFNSASLNQTNLFRTMKSDNRSSLQASAVDPNQEEKTKKTQGSQNQEQGQIPSATDTDGNPVQTPSHKNSQIQQAQNAKRDSRFFDNFTRNSVLYLQKYQINKEKKAIFAVGNNKVDQNDEALDYKGKQLSEQITQYISKYENQLLHSRVQDGSPAGAYEAQIVPSKVKIIYRKPFGEEYYAELEKKEEQDKLEKETQMKSTLPRNFKINFYQSKK